MQKIALVTGASEGIGQAIAERLAADGMQVAMCGRAMESIERASGVMNGRGHAFSVDLSSLASIEHLVASVVARFGGIDVLVNCASATRFGDVMQVADSEWVEGFDVKVIGSLRLMRAAWPTLTERRGCIVNIGGIGARTPRQSNAMTGPLSAALLALTKAFADRGVDDGVRVNAINPGPVVTPRLVSRIDRTAQQEGITRAEALARLARDAGATRMGEPKDVAALVAFMISPAAELMQGSIIDLDGGITKGL